MFHFIPYERNFLFTGRERLLIELEDFFASTLPIPLKIVALMGMPGVGKTEIALEYVYRTQENYRAVIWLEAQSRHQLAEHIVQMLSTVGMKLSWSNEAEREQTFAVFRTWLRRYQSRFLFVLDNLHDYSLLNDVLDDDFVGHVLVTSPSYEATDELKTMIVKPFDEEEGLLFLLHRTHLLALNKPLQLASRAIREVALAIQEEFGGHPLALDQAGAYLEETGTDLATYLSLYRKDRRAFLIRRGTASTPHPFSAYEVIGAMRQGYAYWAEELLFLYLDNLLDCSDPSPHLPPRLPVSSLLQQLASAPGLAVLRANLIQNFLLVPRDGTWGIHPLVHTVMNEVRAAEQEQDRMSRARDDEYEPLDLEGIFQLLIEVQQMKLRQAVLPQGTTPERLDLVRSITITVIPLKRAVLPASKKQREQAKTRIENRYSILAYGDKAPIITTSQDDLRQYAQELLALMQYR